jgi:hypothetical protein
VTTLNTPYDGTRLMSAHFVTIASDDITRFDGMVGTNKNFLHRLHEAATQLIEE